MVSEARLKELLSYDRQTGIFVWIAPSSRTRKQGAIAGHKDANGYIKIKIDGKHFYAHRLAWLYEFGEPPERLIDHKNCDRSDNRIANLRIATFGENCLNTDKHHAASGHRGVRKNSRGELWSATINKDGRSYFLGNYKTKELAASAYRNAAKKHFGEFARFE